MYKRELLRSKALFGGLSDVHLKKVASFLKEEQFKKGTTILNEKEVGDRMYMIVKGNVEVLKYGPEKKEWEKIAELADGDSFGEMELIDIQPCCATVKALDDVETVSLSNPSLLKLSRQDLEAFSIIVVNIARIISRKLRKTDSKLVTILRH